MFSLGSSYFHVPLTTVRHLLNVTLTNVHHLYNVTLTTMHHLYNVALTICILSYDQLGAASLTGQNTFRDIRHY